MVNIRVTPRKIDLVMQSKTGMWVSETTFTMNGIKMSIVDKYAIKIRMFILPCDTVVW